MHIEMPFDQPVVVVSVNSGYDFSRDTESVIAQALMMMAVSEPRPASSSHSASGSKRAGHNIVTETISSIEHALAALREEIAEDLG
jgi:hypothetical protein